jgi:hypothetical protein
MNNGIFSNVWTTVAVIGADTFLQMFLPASILMLTIVLLYYTLRIAHDLKQRE